MDANKPIEAGDGNPDLRQGIQSVEVAALILESLAAGSGPVPLSEVASRAGMKPNKVHRYLVSLIRSGLASQSAISGSYDLGPAIRRIGAAALRRTNDVAIASEFASELRDISAHSVNIAVWGDEGPIIVRWDYGSFALPLSLRVGTVLPLLNSSAGRIFLTYLPEGITDGLLLRSQGQRRAPMAEAEIKRIKAEVRKDGCAVMTGALIPGASAISAPIFTSSDSLPLAMSIVLPGEQLTAETLSSARTMLLDTCQRLSVELGGEMAT
jgi:DNA-binding IclR family transcriptional regulator